MYNVMNNHVYHVHVYVVNCTLRNGVQSASGIVLSLLFIKGTLNNCAPLLPNYMDIVWIG